MIIIILGCTLAIFMNFFIPIEGVDTTINVVIVVVLLLEAILFINVHYLSNTIFWGPFILILTLILSLIYMSVKDHYLPVVNPDQCQNNNTSIERFSKQLTSRFVKNIKISINVQSSSKINAVDESLLHCSDYQTFPNKCRFSVLLKLLEFKDADTLTLSYLIQ